MRSAFKAITFITLLVSVCIHAACIHAETRDAQTLVIDQLWQFSPDPKARFTSVTVDRQAKWRPARASLSWNSQFDDLRDYAGVGWYRVTVALPQPQSS